MSRRSRCIWMDLINKMCKPIRIFFFFRIRHISQKRSIFLPRKRKSVSREEFKRIATLGFRGFPHFSGSAYAARFVWPVRRRPWPTATVLTLMNNQTNHAMRSEIQKPSKNLEMSKLHVSSSANGDSHGYGNPGTN